MHRIAPRRQGCGDQGLGVQIGARSHALQRHGIVGALAMQGGHVIFGIDRNGADAEVGGGAGDTDGDLAAIGDQQGLDSQAKPP